MARWRPWAFHKQRAPASCSSISASHQPLQGSPGTQKDSGCPLLPRTPDSEILKGPSLHSLGPDSLISCHTPFHEDLLWLDVGFPKGGGGNVRPLGSQAREMMWSGLEHDRTNTDVSSCCPQSICPAVWPTKDVINT